MNLDVILKGYETQSDVELDFRIMTYRDRTEYPTPRDVMIDLETIDNGPTSCIASIGACVFDKNGVYDKFYVVVDTKSGIDLGLTWNVDTLEWWSKQGSLARRIFDPATPKVSIREALHLFANWYKQVGGKELWGNGADFDNAIISFAYRLAGIRQPWGYGDSRCFRTIKNGAYMEQRSGIYHNALDDAITQAMYMVTNGLVPVR